MGRRRPDRTPPDRTLERLAERLRSELRKVRKDPSNVKAVHDARVGARRLLAAGDLYAEDSPEWERLRERLPKIIRRMGRLRNLDVAIGFLDRGKRADREARVDLARALKRQRRKERVKLGKWLDRKRLGKIRECLRGAIRVVRQSGRVRSAFPHDLSPFFGRILTLYSERAWSTDEEAAHDVRRQVRLLRYAHETLEWDYPPIDFAEARGQLRKVQQLAGAWHDRTMVEELAERAARKGLVKVPLDPLLVRIRAEGRTYIRKFVKATAQLIRLRGRIEGNPS